MQELALLFELFHSSWERKKNGLFYTDPTIARLMVQRLRDLSKGEPSQVLDPACGAGTLLLESARSFLREGKELPFLLGLDRDPEVLSLLELFLKHLDYPEHRVKLLQGDFLHLPSRPEDREDKSCPPELKAYFLEQGFDWILANPPYGLSRNGRISSEENEYLKKKFAHLRNGKLNKYFLFLGQSLHFLNAQGTACFLVPNSWLGIDSARPLREIILENNWLREVHIFQDAIFEDASVEATLCLLQRSEHDESIQIIFRDADTTSYHRPITRSYCLQRPSSSIPLFGSQRGQALVTSIAGKHPSLEEMSNHFRPMIALQAYARGKGKPAQSSETVRERPFDHNEKTADDIFPYYSGKDVSRFKLRKPRSFLHYGPWLAEPQRLERFQGPRVLVREILGESPNLIHAAFVNETVLYNKSILHILTGPEGQEVDALALCALLNSSFATWWILHSGRKSQRKLFPKLVLADLKAFPIPKNWDEYRKDISTLALARMRADSSTGEQVEIENTLENLFSEAYELRNSEKTLIQEELRKTHPV